MKRVFPLFGFALISAIPFTIWVNWPFIHSRWFDRLLRQAADADRTAALGQFGDSFGALNALFSGFALGGVAFTLWLQIKQIKQQRKDFDQAIAEQRAEEHRQNCLALWQSWSSGDMFGVRERSAIHLGEPPTENCASRPEPRYLESLRRTEPKTFFDIERLLHFLSDVLRFDKAGVIDSALARSLFGPTLQYWARRYSQLSFLSDDADADAYRTRSDEWRKRTVDSLLEWCKQAEQNAEPELPITGF